MQGWAEQQREQLEAWLRGARDDLDLPDLPDAQLEAGPGEDDDLIEPTDNSLRPDDEALPQPPQDPSWRPS